MSNIEREDEIGITMEFSAGILTQIAYASQQPVAGIGRFPTRHWRQVLKRGWAYRTDVEDILSALDSRLDPYRVDLGSLAEQAGYPMQPVRSRPRFVTADWISMDAMTATDLAGLCIFLEQCGFLTDATPMVNDLYAEIATRDYLTLAEGDIYGFAKLRHRCRIGLHAKEALEGAPSQDSWEAAQGYRFERLMRGDQVARLTIQGAKWRRQSRMEITCPVCGMLFTKGDPESSANHRREHDRVTRLLTPRPEPRMKTRLEQVADGERVDVDAKVWMHREMYERALRFKRDFGYDFVQWPFVKKKTDIDPSWIGYLFATPDGTIDGACAFRHEDGEWVLSWVWIRPERRRSGLLSERWSAFVEQYGDFWISHPLSEAMRAFVACHATPGQHRKIAERTATPSEVASDLD
jgi:hypothetical protein